MKRIAIAVVPRALGSAITIPLEMLSAANDVARACKREELVCRLELVAAKELGCELAGGMEIHCQKKISDRDAYDLIFVPGVWRKPKLAVAQHPELVAWIRDQYERGSSLCAAANGAYFVAESGLLNDRLATTHWRYFDDFEKSYPAVNLQRKRFTTSADNIYCTGSVNAIRDTSLHFIETLFDAAIATEVAHHFTHELRRSLESRSLDNDPHSSHHDELIIAAQEWLQQHYNKPVHIAELADQFGLSVRSLNRRFKSATNTTPVQFLQTLRLEQAKELLKRSNLVIAEIADAVGYQDSSYFTELFKKSNAMTPNEYRQLVRNKLFSAASE